MSFRGFPATAPGFLVECHESVASAAHRQDHIFAVCDGAVGVAAIHRRAFEFLKQIVRPNHFSGFLIQTKQIGQDADRVHAVFGYQRRRMRAGAVFHCQVALEGRVVAILPNGFAGGCAGGEHHLIAALAVHGINHAASTDIAE